MLRHRKAKPKKIPPSGRIPGANPLDSTLGTGDFSSVPREFSSTPSWHPGDAGPEFACSFVPGIAAPANSARPARGRRRDPSPGELAEEILRGNRTALSRGITLIESNASGHRSLARELLNILSATARPRAIRVGISGVPGAGKSTLIEALGCELCDRHHRLAVLAVDPSSSLTRGSILGDKTRMELLSRREECFIRPSPSGGALGGVTRKTRETILLCEAAGYDLIIVETVGVGQNEIAVRSMVDCFLLLLIAGAGDELQGMKKGIFEIADVIAVNKADGANLPRALATRSEFERVLHYLTPATPGWKVPVLPCSAIEHSGLDDLWQAIQKYFSHIRSTGWLETRRGEQSLNWWLSLVEGEVLARFYARKDVALLRQSLENRILSGDLPPSVAAEQVLELLET